MALVVNGVCRFALNGTYLDRPWTNICDMQIDTTGTVLNRAEQCYSTAGNIINSWVEHISPAAVPGCTLDSVSWVDLDDEEGTTGSRTLTSEHTLPVAGTNPGDPAAGNLAVLVRKQTASSRGQRPGRWYQTGVSEGGTNGNIIGEVTRARWQAAFDDFLEEINDSPIFPTNFSRQMVVVHTTAEDPKFGTYTPVESLGVDTRLATQRRRLRG